MWLKNLSKDVAWAHSSQNGKKLDVYVQKGPNYWVREFWEVASCQCFESDAPGPFESAKIKFSKGHYLNFVN